MATEVVSYIHMAVPEKSGKEQDLSIPLKPDMDRQRPPWRRLHEVPLTRLLATICVILTVITTVLTLAVGYALSTDSDQRTRLNNQDKRINELTTRVDTLENQIRLLEQGK